MRGDGDNSGREGVQAPGRNEALQGLTAGSDPAPEAPAQPSPKVPGRRVTLSFEGPPLPLPGHLELDVSELGEPNEPAPRSDAAPEPSPVPPLELDLGALDLGDLDTGEQDPAGAGAAGAQERAGVEHADRGDAHDAWTMDRRRRSTPVPLGDETLAEEVPSPHVAAPGLEAAAPHPMAPEGDALGLVDRSRSSLSPGDLASEMRERYALDDFTGALRAAELLLGKEGDNAEAQRYADSSRAKLEQLYSSRLGGFGGVPVVTVRSAEVRWLGLDHRAGFLLSRVDGVSKVEDILDMSGMPRLEALKMLTELLDSGAIRIDPYTSD